MGDEGIVLDSHYLFFWKILQQIAPEENQAMWKSSPNVQMGTKVPEQYLPNDFIDRRQVKFYLSTCRPTERLVTS